MVTVNKSKKIETESASDTMLARPFLIRRVIKESHDTFSMQLESRESEKDFNFKPGQFNMLYVFGVGEVPISISGDPSQNKILTHTTREVGTVTSAMRKLKVGDIIGIRGPYGSYWPVEKGREYDIVIVTGGIGLAPLRPAIYHILANRADYGKFVLLYGARSPEDILYWKDLEKWRSRFDMEVYLTVDRAAGDWHGNVGVVTNLIDRAPFDPTHCLTLVCGPEIMMRFTVLNLQKRGVAADKIYISMERNMKCGIGLCGHCQLGSSFVCKDGPVYCYEDVKGVFTRREM
jgi:NAD(P)H-flavin reductase